MEAYRLLDVGDGARLERFGDRVTDRPHGGALAPRRAPERWADADLRFERERGWTPSDAGPWPFSVDGLTLTLRPTEAGQVGLFPEHAEMLPWLRAQVTQRGPARPSVLHLFAYTGLVTLALAREGAAVAHVDASRPSVTWARENAAASGLGDRPIRWLVDDAPTLVAREIRRGRRYDGIVLDPPTYGHGGRASRRWEVDADLPVLLDGCRRLLADDGFLLLTAHSEHLLPERLGNLLRDAWGPARQAVDTGSLDLSADSGAVLGLGAFARWDRSSP